MAIETLLVKDAGYDLREIRGSREVHRLTEEPDGLVAALGRVTPRTARLAMACVVGLGLLLSVESALVAPLVASVALGVALHAVGELDAEESVTEHVIEEPGMTEREVLQRWTLHDEHERMKEDEAEKEQRRAKRRANTGGGH